MAVINKIRDYKAPLPTDKFNNKANTVYLDIKDFNTLIYNEGCRVKVYTTLFCPRCHKGSAQNFNCPLCHGTGFIDINPVDTYVYFSENTEQYHMNVENTGSTLDEQLVHATFLEGVELTYSTKVELTDYTNLFDEVILKQKDQSQGNGIGYFKVLGFDNKTKVLTIENPSHIYDIKVNDVLVDPNGKKFLISEFIDENSLKIFTEADTFEMSEPCQIYRPEVDQLRFRAHSVVALIDYEGDNYVEGSDFIINRNGNIAWISNHKPAEGTYYTICYNTLVAFRALRAIHGQRFINDGNKKPYISAVEAPQQWVLKKLFFYNKTDSISGGQIEPNEIYLEP